MSGCLYLLPHQSVYFHMLCTQTYVVHADGSCAAVGCICVELLQLVLFVVSYHCCEQPAVLVRVQVHSLLPGHLSKLDQAPAAT
jgi:hypothetical protein